MKEAIIQYNDTPSGGHLAISWEPLVRCKDCKHKEKDGISEGFHYCNVNGLQVTDDWFCADGERKSE